jgi:ArsR family transcriptional regulator, arsenate/arsenite/antimonite-responsive transcriptional repressor
MRPSYNIHISRHMDITIASETLSALSHATRLQVFRTLVAAEPDGLPAGEIARRKAVPHNTMSSHLAVLARAGLVLAERRSRSIIYRADLNRLRQLMLFLLVDCCGGKPELCSQIMADLVPCCSEESCAHA